MPQIETPSETVSEWVEERDANGRLVCLYSPVRDVIQLKGKDGTTEIDLHDLRQRGLMKLLRAVTRVKR